MKRSTIIFFRLVSLFGSLFTLAQLILKSMHSSICTTQGCLLVAQSVRFSDSIIIFAGFLVFSLLFLLSLSKNETLQKIVDALIVISLSAEGIFVGYQLFRIKHICLFCLSVFALFVILALIRLVQRRYFVLTGFASFVTVLGLCYMLKPSAAPVIATKPLVLVYKPTCSHCEKVIEEARKKHVNIYTVKAGSCLDLLRMLNINEVPVLIANKKGRREIIVGEENIIQYLFNDQNSSSNSSISPIFETPKGFCSIEGGSCSK